MVALGATRSRPSADQRRSLLPRRVGADAADGITTAYYEEAEVRRVLVDCADRVVGLASREKLGRGRVPIAPATALTTSPPSRVPDALCGLSPSSASTSCSRARSAPAGGRRGRRPRALLRAAALDLFSSSPPWFSSPAVFDGREHHHHVAPVLLGPLLDHRELAELLREAVEQLLAALGMGHLAAAEHDRHLDLVAPG